MKKLISVFAIFLMAFAYNGLPACASPQNEVVTPSRNYTSKEFKVSKFSAISSNSIIDVEYTQSTDYTKVEVSAPENLMKFVKISVTKNGCLNIDCDKFTTKKLTGNFKITAKVTAPSVKSFSSNGTGDITLRNALNMKDNVKFTLNGTGDLSGPTIVCADLQCSLNGTGDINLTSVTCRNLSINSSGTGDIDINIILNSATNINLNGTGDIDIKSLSGKTLAVNLSGTGDVDIEGGSADSATYTLSGTGDIDAKKLNAANVTATNHSVGDIECCATQSLVASNTGTGSVRYRGYPQKVDLNSKGIKRIK